MTLFPTELFLAYTLVETCPVCEQEADHTPEECESREHDEPPDEPGCCSVLQPCGDGCNCPPEWRE